MSYQDFKERIDRDRTQSVLPRVSHDDPGYIWASSRNPRQADLLTRIHIALVDDPQQSIKNIEELRNGPSWDEEARGFFDQKLQELRREISR